MARRWVTIGYSDHRVESLDAASAVMRGHRAVVLEEPPVAGLATMLEGRSTIDDQVAAMVPEFPEYSRRQYELMRALHVSDVRILQVEPYMAALEAIHDLFDAGHRPGEIEERPVLGAVYRSERQCTGTLLNYYAAANSDDFHRVIETVCDFARADAGRGRLRDRMRARELTSLILQEGVVYVEAGSVHAGLVGELRRSLPTTVPVRPRWLLAPVMRQLGGRSPTLRPGDLLTLAYAFKRHIDPLRQQLLAARSLIQVVITTKEEMLPSEGVPYPHTLDEVRSCRLVEQLDLDDCRRLYPTVRTRPAHEARRVVERYLASQAS